MLKNIKIALALCLMFLLFCCSSDKPEEALLCGINFYDEQTEFCYYDEVYTRCGGQRYRPGIQICRNNIVLTGCGREYYDEKTEFCYNDAVYARCKWNEYDPEKEKCDNGIILTKCGGDYYNERMEFCYNNSMYKKCNRTIYDLTKQRCAENDSLLNICKDIPYEPYSQYCIDGNVTGKEIFTDLRDGKEYKTVIIGKQIWMAENLNYSGDNNSIGKCYPDFDYTNYTPIELCDKYGRLYDWETAMRVCPDGWHLPSLKEWQKLSYWVDDETGKKLKSTSGWKCIGEWMVLSDYFSEWYDEWGDLISTMSHDGSCDRLGDGSDEFGFSALPGGVISHKGSSGYAREYGFWWSSANKGDTASFLSLVHFTDNLGGGDANKLHQLSVRCVKD
jgi:hypothetical protein